MALLADLVAASADVARTPGRLRKIARLADVLARLEGAEIESAVAFLSGAARQGSLGVGDAAISAASDVAAAAQSTLTIDEVDDVFGQLQAIAGAGAAARRAQLLRSLFSRATAPEQDFLRRRLTAIERLARSPHSSPGRS